MTITPAIIIGTAIFTIVDGKLHLVGTPVNTPKVFPTGWVMFDKNTIVTYPTLYKTNE